MSEKKFDEDEFKEKIKQIFPKIKPGLQKGKKLYEDGIMNLDLMDIDFLLDKSEISNCVLIFLAFLIQAYPKDQVEFKKGQDFECVKTFEMFLGIAGNQKQGILICETQGNKLNPKKNVKIQITDLGIELGKQMGLDCNFEK